MKTIDEVLEMLAVRGPAFASGLSNQAPMGAEALTARVEVLAILTS